MCISTATAWGFTAIVPASQGTTEGNSAYGFNFQLTGQQLYPATALTALPTGAIIQGMRTRLNASEFNTAEVSVPSFDVYLGPSSSSTLSSAFSANQSSATVHTRSGVLTFAAGAFPTGGTPNEFGQLIPFSTPYIYQGGGLVMTLAYSNSNGDLLWDASQSISGAHWIQALTYNAPAAQFSTLDYAMIVQFEYAIPEPSSLAVTVAVFGARVRRR